MFNTEYEAVKARLLYFYNQTNKYNGYLIFQLDKASRSINNLKHGKWIYKSTIILLSQEGVNIHWLLTGQGEMGVRETIN